VAAHLTAEEIIANLKLGPHSEGGYFRETFRDEPGHRGRAHSTAILYLPGQGSVALASRRRGRDVALV
jgi:predicted cupin superfamily sugar epimerase